MAWNLYRGSTKHGQCICHTVFTRARGGDISFQDRKLRIDIECERADGTRLVGRVFTLHGIGFAARWRLIMEVRKFGLGEASEHFDEMENLIEKALEERLRRDPDT